MFCKPDIEGILLKGPYPPCVSMAARALLAGYHRYVAYCYNMALLQIIPRTMHLIYRQCALVWFHTGWFYLCNSEIHHWIWGNYTIVNHYQWSRTKLQYRHPNLQKMPLWQKQRETKPWVNNCGILYIEVSKQLRFCRNAFMHLDVWISTIDLYHLLFYTVLCGLTWYDYFFLNKIFIYCPLDATHHPCALEWKHKCFKFAWNIDTRFCRMVCS